MRLVKRRREWLAEARGASKAARRRRDGKTSPDINRGKPVFFVFFVGITLKPSEHFLRKAATQMRPNSRVVRLDRCPVAGGRTSKIVSSFGNAREKQRQKCSKNTSRKNQLGRKKRNKRTKKEYKQ